jgi:hypothetical protein
MINLVGRRCLLFAFLSLALVAPVAAGEAITVTGDVVETYCWAVHQVGGAGHAQCGIECAKRGLPVALYDTKTRVAYILLPARDKASLPPELVALMDQRVTIRGERVVRGGIPFLVTQSWQRAK